MKIYLVMWDRAFEDSYIVKIFAKQSSADAFCKECNDKKSDDDFYHVNEMKMEME